MATWHSITSDPEFKQLTPEQQEKTRVEFFKRTIAPEIPRNQLQATWEAFDQKTRSQGTPDPEVQAEQEQQTAASKEALGPLGPKLEGISENVSAGFAAMQSGNSSLSRATGGVLDPVLHAGANVGETAYQLAVPWVLGSLYGSATGAGKAAAAFKGGASLDEALSLFAPSVEAGIQTAAPDTVTPLGTATVDVLGNIFHYLEKARQATGDFYFKFADVLGYSPEARGAAGAMGQVGLEAAAMLIPYKLPAAARAAREGVQRRRVAKQEEAARSAQESVRLEDEAIQRDVLKEIEEFNQEIGIVEAEGLPRNSVGEIMKAPDSVSLLPFSVWKDMWYKPSKAEEAGVAARERLATPGKGARELEGGDPAFEAYRFYAQNVYDYNVAKTRNMLATRSGDLSMRAKLDDHLASLMKKESEADSVAAGIEYTFDTTPGGSPTAPRGPADRPMVVRRGGQDGPLVPRMENKVPVADPKGSIESFKGEFGMDYIPPVLSMTEWMSTRAPDLFKEGSKTRNAIESSRDAKGNVVFEAIPKKFQAQIKRKYGQFVQRQLNGDIDFTGRNLGQRDLTNDMIVGEVHRAKSARERAENLREMWEAREMHQSAVKTAQIETMWAERGHYTIESRLQNEINRSNPRGVTEGGAAPRRALGSIGPGRKQSGMFKFELDDAAKNLAANLDPRNLGKAAAAGFTSFADNRRKRTPGQIETLRDVGRDKLMYQFLDTIFYQSHSMLQTLATKHPVMRELVDHITEPAMSVTRKRQAQAGTIYKGKDAEVNQRASFREAKDVNKATWLTELDKAFQEVTPTWFPGLREIARRGAAIPRKVNDELVGELVGMSPLTRASQKFRDALDKIYYDTKGAGVPVEQYLKNYLPLQFRQVAFSTVNKRNDFQQMLVDKYKWKSEDAAKLTEQIAWGEFTPIKFEKAQDFNQYAKNREKDGTFGRKAAAEFHRKLKDVKWDDLAPFIETDLGNLLFNYVEAMATRKAMAEKFGANFEKVHKALEEINAEMAKKGDALTTGEIARVYDILDALQNTYHRQHSQAQRGLSYATTTASHWALLPWSAVMSLGEVMFSLHRAGPVNLAKSMPVAIKAAGIRAARSIYKDLDKTDLEIFTDSLGKTFDQSLLHRAEEMWSGAGPSGSQLLFKANLQNTVTSFSHLLAAEVFRNKLAQWGKAEMKGGPKNPFRKAQHEQDRMMLNNMGLDTRSVVDFVRSGKDMRTEAPAVIKLGAVRWANLQVLMRDPAKLPLPFSSQGTFARAFHTIQTFPAMFGIQHSKQWLMDVVQNVDIAARGHKKYGLDIDQRKMAAFASANSVASAAGTMGALLAMAYMIVNIRDYGRYGSEGNPYYAGKSEEEITADKIKRALKYTGILGRVEQFGSAPFEAVTTYRNDPVVSAMGAPIQAASKVFTAGVKSFNKVTAEDDWRYSRPFFKAIADYTPILNIRADARHAMANVLSGNPIDYRRGRYGSKGGRKRREGSFSSPFSSSGGSFSSNF